MTTRSGRQHSNSSTMATVTLSNPTPPPNPRKCSQSETFGCFDLSNTQGGLHDLPKDANSWLPLFSGKGLFDNSHWAQFCDTFEFHQTSHEHPDVFMRLFAISLIRDAKIWINACPKGSIRNPKELEKAFKIRWCNNEHTRDFFSQYLDIYQGSCEGVKNFNDRFNLLLKKVRPKLSSKEAILEHYLNSLEGTLQFTLRNRSPSTLEEAQDLAYQIERNLKFEDYICQVNHSRSDNLLDPGDDFVTEPKLPKSFKLNPHLLRGNGVFLIPMYRIPFFRSFPWKLSLPRKRTKKLKSLHHTSLSMTLLKISLSLSTK
jgi:hypothetical protein